MNAARLLVAFSDDVAGEPRAPIDAIFPVLHGPFGEDGSVQGLAHWSMCLRPSPQDRRAGAGSKRPNPNDLRQLSKKGGAGESTAQCSTLNTRCVGAALL